MQLLKKLIERIQAALPGQRVHFIYSHKNGDDRFQFGLKANTEISYWGFTALQKAFPRVSFLRIEKEKPWRIASIKPKDIVIGHIGETFLKASARTQRMIAFYPWTGHPDRSENTLFNCIALSEELEYLSKARSIIWLTSEYNVRHYIEKQTNFWHPLIEKFKREDKRVRAVHQPLDLSLFPRTKQEYRTSEFLYVGSDAHMKCLAHSRQLVESLGKKLTVYGVGGKILQNHDPAQVSRLADQADFFIQPGMWEAQCVSILEAAARGFIPVVSQDTGYPYEHPYFLRYGDFAYNQKVLKELINTSFEERKALADFLHQQLISDPNHNDWETLTKVLVEEIILQSKLTA